jgi:hypothetical protein
MIRGGVADKIGNGYEALWTVQHALDVLRGYSDELRFEPFNEGASGFEFRVNSASKVTWHQCKFRRATGNWTMRALQDEGVFDDFARKLAGPDAECVFVSGDVAADFKALTGKARLAQDVDAFGDILNNAEGIALGHLRKIWNVTPDVEFDRLSRCRVEISSAETLKHQAETVCSLLFADDPEIAVERLICLLNDNLTHAFTTNRLRSEIEGLGLTWLLHLDETLDEAIASATDQYLGTLSGPICDVRIDKADSRQAAAWAVSGAGRKLVLAGQAGCGKSDTMAQIVRSARDAGIPVLAFRMDRLLASTSVKGIGQSVLERSVSPVAALGNRFSTRRSLLIIDQVDAISDASGRSGIARDMLLKLAAETEHYPEMRLVLACRSYDLENDRHLKNLASSERTTKIDLRLLEWDGEVAPLVASLGIAKRTFTDRERRILTVPINLQVFSVIARSEAPLPSEISSGRLFDTLVDQRAREVGALGLTWTPFDALGDVAAWMSANQELAAPVGVLSRFQDGVPVLVSAGLLTRTGDRVQFAHESFFDHVFSAYFVNSGQSLLQLLISDEQRLFRRTQVRQILARLREQSARTYLKSLQEIMESDEVRYLVKDAVGMWLNDLAAPTQAELSLVQKWDREGHPLSKIAAVALSGTAWAPLLLSSGEIRRWLDRNEEATRRAEGLLRRTATIYPTEIAKCLREWWSEDSSRTARLLEWFSRLHPDGDIGELESLYEDAIDAIPTGHLNSEHPGRNFDLGPWTHKGGSLGARVLGLWLRRWQREFPEGHAFPRFAAQDDKYWVKEIATHRPADFLDAVLPPFVEALAREDRAVASGKYYRGIRVPESDDDEAIATLIAGAFEKLANEKPEGAEARLALLPPHSSVAAFIRLRVIAANGEYFWERLIGMLEVSTLMDTDELGGGWYNFAAAAKAALPYTDNSGRLLVEGFNSSVGASQNYHGPSNSFACIKEKATSPIMTLANT